MILHLQFADTNVFSHAELDLSIEYLPIIVAFEIQALVATRIMSILNFFVPKFWISMSYSVEYNDL